MRLARNRAGTSVTSVTAAAKAAHQSSVGNLDVAYLYACMASSVSKLDADGG